MGQKAEEAFEIAWLKAKQELTAALVRKAQLEAKAMAQYCMEIFLWKIAVWTYCPPWITGNCFQRWWYRKNGTLQEWLTWRLECSIERETKKEAMMKPTEFYDRLQSLTESSTLALSPGPLVFKVGIADAMAAKLLLWLYKEMPEDAKVKDMFDVLDAAHWWATFWSSLSDSEEAGNEVDDDCSHPCPGCEPILEAGEQCPIPPPTPWTTGWPRGRPARIIGNDDA